MAGGGSDETQSKRCYCNCRQAIKAEQSCALWEFWVVHAEGREGELGPFLAEIELGLNFGSRS